jgi:hypothetical protein
MGMLIIHSVPGETYIMVLAWFIGNVVKVMMYQNVFQLVTPPAPSQSLTGSSRQLTVIKS